MTAPSDQTFFIPLHKKEWGQAWGFRLIGGTNHGQPLIVQKVSPGGIAFHGGLRERDQIVQVGNINVIGLTHSEVQEIILKCGNQLDLVVSRAGGEKQELRSKGKEQQTESLKKFYTSNSIEETLTKQVQVLTEGAYYSKSSETKSDAISPPVNKTKEHFIEAQKEETRVQFSSNRPPSPKLLPQSPSPFSKPQAGNQYSFFSSQSEEPTRDNNPKSNTSPNQQKPMAQKVFDQQPADPRQTYPVFKPRDNRVFGANYKAPSQSNELNQNMMNQNIDLNNYTIVKIPKQTNVRVFGSDNTNQQQQQQQPQQKVDMNQSHIKNAPQVRDNRTFGANVNPSSQQNQGKQSVQNENRNYGVAPQILKHQQSNPQSNQQSNQQPNQPSSHQILPNVKVDPNQPMKPNFQIQPNAHNAQDPRVFGGSNKPEPNKNWTFQQQNKDPRVFAPSQKFKQQVYPQESAQDWNEQLPIISNNYPDLILPSQAKNQQSYISHLPPTGLPGMPTRYQTVAPQPGNAKINPVWPPKDYDRLFVSKVGFSPEEPKRGSLDLSWPPEGFDGTTRTYAQRPGSPGPLTNAWQPGSGTATPPHMRGYVPTGRVRNVQWPPQEFGRISQRQSSLPPGADYSSRRSSQVSEDSFKAINRIPRTYRPPPGTQYYRLDDEPTNYYYDTE